MSNTTQATASPITATKKEVEVDVVEKAKDFWAKFSKPILYVGSTVIILASAWILYKNFVVAPKEEKAAELIFPAEELFDNMARAGFDDNATAVVLNGGNGMTGVLKIANSYSGTAAGARAQYIAGACYLHKKDFNNAVKYLSEFKTSATQIQTAAYSMLGDAYAELKKNDDAYDAYKKATQVNTKDEFMTSEALFKAGLFAQSINKTDDAIDMFKKIRDEYPKSNRASDIDKYLARLGVTK